MEETWDHVSVHWQQGNYQLWANCVMYWNPVSIAGSHSLKATPPPTIMLGVLTTRPWPVRQKRTGTSRMVSHTRHDNGPTLSMNDSPLVRLHLALAYKYHFCEVRRASHCHSPQTTYSLKSTCCVIPAKYSTMHVVVYAGRLTSQRSNVEIINW